MKFFNIIPISSSQSLCWGYLDDVQDTPEPFHLLCFHYSMNHSLSPRNGDPNSAASTLEIPAARYGMFDPLPFLQFHLYSTREGIQHGCEHDPCSQLPSESEYPLNCIFEQPSHDNASEHPPAKQNTDTWSPKLYELLNDLHYGMKYDNYP